VMDIIFSLLVTRPLHNLCLPYAEILDVCSGIRSHVQVYDDPGRLRWIAQRGNAKDQNRHAGRHTISNLCGFPREKKDSNIR